MCSTGPGTRSHGEQRSTQVCPYGTTFSPISGMMMMMIQPGSPPPSLPPASLLQSLHLSPPPHSPPRFLLDPSAQPLGTESSCTVGRGQGPSERNGGADCPVPGCVTARQKGWSLRVARGPCHPCKSVLEGASAGACAPFCVGLFFAEDTF